MNGSPSSRQKATPVASTRLSLRERPRSSHSPIRLNGQTPSSSEPWPTAGRWSYRISSSCSKRGMLLSSIIAGAETNQAARGQGACAGVGRFRHKPSAFSQSAPTTARLARRVNDLECSESLCVGSKLRGRKKRRPPDDLSGADLYRTASRDGVFFYTFFKGTATLD